VLVKKAVFQAIPYPHFVYHSALNHANTISEDVDFCAKALKKGFKIYADTAIKCRHIGQGEFTVDDSIPAADNSITDRLRDLSSQRLLPKPHVDYLQHLKDSGFEPSVIYDVGACVLHWTNEAKQIWPNSNIVAFEAMPSCEFLYKEKGIPYHIGVLSDESGKTVEFYQNDWHPGGNSYYIENSDINANSAFYFNETHKRTYQTVALDAVHRLKQLPKPELLKMDVQGAELDVLRGAAEVLETVEHVILELQSVEYNKGAPLRETVVEYMHSIGFDLVAQFTNYGPDGDYHFKRR
jgi:FkbM family methyltransferase